MSDSEIRVVSKFIRKQLASAINSYVLSHESDHNKALKWYYSTVTDTIYINLFRRKAEQLIADWECRNPRDEMTDVELCYICEVEQLTTVLIRKEGYEPIVATLEAMRRIQPPLVTR